MCKYILALFALVGLCGCANLDKKNDSDQKNSAQAKTQAYDIAAYYWPAYHPEPRWKDIKIFGDGLGEWQNVYEAKPKFVGHDQPKVPIFGYDDESSTEGMTWRINAASDYGVNVFIFDWYWYEGKPFLEAPINKFVELKTNKMKFYIMWANHDVMYSGWSNKVHLKTFPPEDKLWSGAVDLPEFKRVADRLVAKYFKEENYYKIDGKPVLSFYDTKLLIEGLGGLENTKAAFKYLDEAAKKAGLKGVHIQLVYTPQVSTQLPGVPGNTGSESQDTLKYLGVESLTSYTWVHYRYSNGLDYKDWGDFSVQNWDKITKEFPSMPFYNHVSVGWDNNPRYPISRLTPIIMRTSPALFEDYIKQAMAWTDTHHPKGVKLITINSWNEWTEGSYLEPDMHYGWGYLEAIKRALESVK